MAPDEVLPQSRDDVVAHLRAFVASHDPRELAPLEYLRARFDAGLAHVSNPPGLGGLGADAALQPVVDAAFEQAGAPGNRAAYNVIGLGMAMPVLLRFGTEEQKRRWIRPLWTGEEIWCQLFSEPGAGSDLAAVGASAELRGDEWVVNGQKVWTSLAHEARWGLLLVRTDPGLPKHQGLSYFVCDMQSPGVEVRPLRQMTGETEFNEVFLDDVRVPDAHRLGEVGEGWRVAQATLMNERVTIGAGTPPREGGPIGPLSRTWRTRPDLRREGLHDRLLQLWVRAEALRISSVRLAQQTSAGMPGPEASGAKLSYARLAQECSSLELDLLADEGLLYEDWTARRPVLEDESARAASFRFLRTKANSIEGGTSEVMLNIVAERVLGLPAEPRVDKDVAWKDLPR